MDLYAVYFTQDMCSELPEMEHADIQCDDFISCAPKIHILG
jgi:hypothetical protein